MARLAFGFGVIPRDVLNGFAIDSGIVVRGGSDGDRRGVSLSDGGEVGLGGPFPWTDSAVCPKGEKVRWTTDLEQTGGGSHLVLESVRRDLSTELGGK